MGNLGDEQKMNPPSIEMVYADCTWLIESANYASPILLIRVASCDVLVRFNVSVDVDGVVRLVSLSLVRMRIRS